MKLVLLRHGRSTANADGVLAGRTEGVSLDATGRKQAQALAEPFGKLTIAGSYSSPIQRCLETAQHAGLEPLTMAEFTECDYGQWTGAKLSELADQSLWRHVQVTPSEVKFPDGEAMVTMYQRVTSGLAALEAKHGSDDVVVVVSHGDPIKAAIAHYLGIGLDEFQRIHVAPASISIVITTSSGSRPLVACVNGTSESLAQLTVAGPAVGGGDLAPASRP